MFKTISATKQLQILQRKLAAAEAAGKYDQADALADAIVDFRDRFADELAAEAIGAEVA